MSRWRLKQADIDSLKTKGMSLSYVNVNDVEVFIDNLTALTSFPKADAKDTLIKVTCDVGRKLDYFVRGSAVYVNGVRTTTSLSLVGTGTDAYGSYVELAPINENEALTVAYMDINIVPDGDYFGLYGNATYTIEGEIPDVITANNKLYIVDDLKIAQINSARFTFNSSDSAISDYGTYIINIVKVPFVVPTDIYGDETGVLLGNLNTDVICQELIAEKHIIDFGDLIVLPVNNNILDYEGVIYRLHLPYTDYVDLDVDYILNKTINLSYEFNLYTGEATIKLKSSVTENVIFIRVINMGVDIPYADPRNNTVSNIDVSTLADNKIYQPFIEIISPVSNNVSGNAIVPDSGLIGDYKGYLEVERIDLNSSLSSSDISKLESLLTNGVIIK